MHARHAFRTVTITALGGLLGALAVSLLVHGLIVYTKSDIRYDGQYGMIFFFGTLPLGWLLGCAVSGFSPKARPNGLSAIGRLCLVVLTAGLGLPLMLQLLVDLMTRFR